MTAADRLPRTLLDPRLDGPERDRLVRALKGVEIAAPKPDQPASGRPANQLERQPENQPAKQPEPKLGMLGALVFGAVAITAGPIIMTRNRIALDRIRKARRAGRLIIPAQDLDPDAQAMLRTVLDAVRQVSGSRAQRDGQLADGWGLLQDQQWRISIALMRLSEARRLLRQTGGRLDEHLHAVRVTEQAVERRVHAVLAYAESVHRVDATLADIEAASYTISLDHKLRDTLAALGEERSLDALTTESRTAQVAVDEALRGLRHQTDLLRSATEDEL